MTLQIETLPTAALTPYARNARTHSPEQVAQIAASIREFGFTNPVLIDAEGGIIAGHGRVMAANRLGLADVPCIRLAHLSDAQRRAYVIADNQLALNAGWDKILLGSEIQDLQKLDFDLGLLGFSDFELDEILAELGADDDEKKNPDRLPPESETVITQKGDIWNLGKHRVMCGDCADLDSVKQLMAGAMAGCSVTSPPYAMQRKDSYGGVDEADYPAWFAKVADCVMSVLSDNGSFFVNIKEHVVDGERSLYVFKTIEKMRAKGWRYVDQLIWTKPGLPGGWPNRLKNDFEPIHFFTKRDQINWMIQTVNIDQDRLEQIEDPGMVDLYEDIYHFSKSKKIKFKPKAVGKKSDQIRVYNKNNDSYSPYTGNIDLSGKMKTGIARPGNVIFMQGNTESIKHTAMFPVGLPAFFMKLTTDVGECVYEPFGGAGSTIIAGEQTGRMVNAMEIQPHYVDLIVRRWQDFTGSRAYHAKTGQPFPANP